MSLKIEQIQQYAKGNFGALSILSQLMDGGLRSETILNTL